MKGILKKIGTFAFVALSFASVVTLSSCKVTTHNPVDPNPGTVVPTPGPVDPVDPTPGPVDPVGPTEEERRQTLIDNANAAIESLASKNMTVKIGDDVYKIDEYNLDKNGIVYEANVNNYNVYTLADKTEQSYTKTETTDSSFRNIQVGEWQNIFTIGDEIKLDSVDIESETAYVAKKGTGAPLFEISYNDNGFTLSNDSSSVDFYDIGSTEVNIPTNIKVDSYLVKDGKYDLASLKTVLTDWVNGENKDNMNVFYDTASRNLVDIKLINIKDGALSFYAEAAAKSGNTYLSYVEFKSEAINKEVTKQNLKVDDFKDVIYNLNSLNIIYRDVFKISNNVSAIQAKKRAQNVLAADEIKSEVVFAYETDAERGNLTYGNDVTYKMACFTADGHYYEYVVNALTKMNVYDNDTSKFDVIQKVNKELLQENLIMYNVQENLLNK